MTTFVTAVNDVLVLDGIIAGDDDAITSFGSTQHVASIRFAKKAIQQELAALVADEKIPYEQTTGVLTVSSRLVTLDSDFIRFQDQRPFLYETDSGGTEKGNWIVEYPGGEEKLRRVDIRYRINQGKPFYWYWPGGTTKQLAFYNVPNATYYYRYFYEKDVSVTDESDTVPFTTATEVATFVEMAARRFKYLRSSPTVRESLFPGGLANDAVIQDSRTKHVRRLVAARPDSGRRQLPATSTQPWVLT